MDNTKWLRDWVYNVVSPFFKAIKNRLANIRIESIGQGKYRFYTSENVPSDIQGLLTEPVKSINLIKPLDARYSRSSMGVEGRLVIKYPFEGASFSMNLYTLKVYLYNVDKSFTAIIGGYNYSSPHWYNITAKGQVADIDDIYRPIEFVRFLKEGGDDSKDEDYTHFGFIIGENDDTTWAHPRLAITEVLAGHNNIEYDRWATGWSFDILKDADIAKHTVDYTRSF